MRDEPLYTKDKPLSSKEEIGARSSGDVMLGVEEGFINPFINETVRMSKYEWVKCFIMSILLIPFIKILFFLGLLIIAAFWISIVLCCYRKRDNVPMGIHRRRLLMPARILVRLAMFTIGFLYYKVERPKDEKNEANLIVSNHIGHFDWSFFVYYSLPSVAMSTGAQNIPLVGTILSSIQPIYVDRFSKEGKGSAAEEIEKRAKNEGGQWPQLLIFPEGTTSNQRTLTAFKKGAFTAGANVQPVILKYPFKHYDVTAVPLLNQISFLYRHLCQIYIPCHIKYLPVYVPNEEEKKNPMLYARNVRDLMAKEGGFVKTEHACEDAYLLSRASFSSAPYYLQHIIPIIDAHSMNKVFKMTPKEILSLLKQFKQYDVNLDGSLNFTEFCAAMSLDESTYSQTVFELLDKDNSGSIDFKDLLLGMALLSTEMGNIEKVDFCFQVYDHTESGYISKDDLIQVMKIAGETTYGAGDDYMSDEKLSTIVSEYASPDHKISFSQFEKAVEKYPKLLDFVSASFSNKFVIHKSSIDV